MRGWLGVVWVSAIVALGCGDDATSGPGDGAEPSPLVDPAWLAERLGDEDVQILDARPNPSDFETSRIPGALRLDPYEVTATVDGIGAQIAPPSVAGPLLRERGLRMNTAVVVYGASPEFDPARVLWALRYYGHRSVRYLDGGWDAWIMAGQPVETGNVAYTPSDYRVELDDSIRVTGAWVLEQLGDPPYDKPAIQIVDARAPAEYDVGRIPGARLIPWSMNLEGGFMRSREEVEQLHAGLNKSKTVVVYCLVGWRGAFTWLALTWLGFEDVRLYDGSWLEWGAVPGFPIETDDGIS